MRVTTLLLALSSLIGLTGCLSRVGMRFTKDQVGKAHIDPRFCHPLPDGNAMCDRVKVLLVSVPAKEEKE